MIPLHTKRSSYILAIMKPSDFIQLGGRQLLDGCFFIKRTYDGTSSGESCALIGISRHKVSSLLEDKSDFFEQISLHPEFQDIPGIQNLSLKIASSYYSFFIPSLKHVQEDDLFLFNIEPKAEGRLQRFYPAAQVTLPGGSMEQEDNFSFENCAKREFEEETGFIFDRLKCEDIKSIRIKQIGRNNKLKFTHFCSSPTHKRVQKSDNIHFISMFYMKRLSCLSS
jgi:hypothetical protein